MSRTRRENLPVELSRVPPVRFPPWCDMQTEPWALSEAEPQLSFVSVPAREDMKNRVMGKAADEVTLTVCNWLPLRDA